MMWKFVRRRAVVVAAFPIVLAAVVVAVAGGSDAKTTGKDATRAYGIARASSAVGSTGNNMSVASPGTAGPQVINGQFQGTSPPVSTLPALPMLHAPLKANQIESQKPGSAPPAGGDSGKPG